MVSSTASSTAIDLSRLTVPDVVEALDYEAIFAQHLAAFQEIYPEFDALLESDPAIKALQVGAYQELLLRQRVNDASRANFLATAQGADLDNLAALFGVMRLILQPANDQTGEAADYEGDDALRRRVLLAPDSYSVAGPVTAYVYHALSAHGDVADAAATSPNPGEVIVSVLSRIGDASVDGTAPAALIAAVEAVVNADDIRPLTDQVSVQSAVIVPFDITAELTLFSGPDTATISAAAHASLVDLLENRRSIGLDIPRSALFAALHVGGVAKVDLTSPAADVQVGDTGSAHAANITLTIAPS